MKTTGITKFKFGVSIIIAFLLLFVIVMASKIYYIRPGHVGVLIYKIPPAGNTKGIAEICLNPGYGLRSLIRESVIEYPIYMQTIVLCKGQTEGSQNNDEINVNSVEGQPMSCDVSLSYELKPEKVPELYVAIRQPIESITHGFVKQTIRQAMQEIVGRTKIEDFLGKEKASVVQAIQKLIQLRLEEYGFMVKQFTINEIRAPQSITTAIEQKNAAAQEALKAQNDLSRKLFEAQQNVAGAEGEAKAILAKAKAEAEANRLVSNSISPVLIKYETIKKWNGVLPQVSGGAMPLINMGDINNTGAEAEVKSQK
jgi:regulator of protease activity HflC (stomatin/prohibitin superfamily)